MLKIQKVLRFTKKDLDKHGKEIADAHKAQTEMGVDFEGKTFASYTSRYRKNKASGKAVKGQKSISIQNISIYSHCLSAIEFIMEIFCQIFRVMSPVNCSSSLIARTISGSFTF